MITYGKQIHIFNNWSEVKEYQKLNKGKEIKPSRVKKFESRDKALAWTSMMADWKYGAIKKAKARNDYSAFAMLWSDGAIENK